MRTFLVISLLLQLSAWSEPVKQILFRAETCSTETKLDPAIVLKANETISTSKQVDYLVNIADGITLTNTSERATALLLLGQTKSISVVDTLLRNISIYDNEQKIYPSEYALAELGPLCATNIMQYIANGAEPRSVGVAQNALMRIYEKNTKEYFDLLNRYKYKLPARLYDQMSIVEF